MLDWGGSRKIRRSGALEGWFRERDAAHLVSRMKSDVDAAVELSPRATTLARALRVLDFVEAARVTPLLDEPARRREVLDGLRAHLLGIFEAGRLGSFAAAARSSFALELLVSLGDPPSRSDRDYPEVDARARDIGLRLGLSRREADGIACQIAVAVEGDCGEPGREPHLALGFFAGMLAGERPVVRQRMAQLAKWLVRARVWQVDTFLWFHLFGRAKRSKEVGSLRSLFARNARLEVEAALRALMTDDAAFERMKKDSDGPAPGTAPYLLREGDLRGLDGLRDVVRERHPHAWIHFGDPLGALAVREALGLKGRCTLASQASRGDAALDRMLPLARDPRLRILEDDEERRLRSRLRAEKVAGSADGPITPASLRAARGRGRPLLVTDAGGYLGVARTMDSGPGRRAAEDGLSGVRCGSMAFAEAVLSLLRPGDVAAFFGGPGAIPYLRAATWLSLEVREDARPHVTAIAWRQRFPGLEARWEPRP